MLYLIYLGLLFLLESVRKEAVTITTVFPSPNDVMSILVQVCCKLSSMLFILRFCNTTNIRQLNYCSCIQRVLEQRVTGLLDRLLIKPSLVDLPPIKQGGLLQVSLII